MNKPVKQEVKRLPNGTYPPGVSGNPKGRKRNEETITSIMRGMLGKPCKYDDKVTWAEYLAERGLALAATKPEAWRNVLDRLEGKVSENLSLTGEGGKPIEFILSFRERDA